MRQMVQVISARLQRVTFTALRRLLGLACELVSTPPPYAYTAPDGRGPEWERRVKADVLQLLGLEVGACWHARGPKRARD